MKNWSMSSALGCLVILMGVNLFMKDHRITELTARANSLQAECDSLHQVIDTNPRYMKGLMLYWSADDPFIIYHSDRNPDTIWTKLKELK
jgi:hypothetical protein